MKWGGCVYILTNKNKTTLYIGVTADLDSRIHNHKSGINKNSFTYRYNLHYLIYFESFSTITEAILREKELKGWTRKRKEELINSINPSWDDWSEREDL